MHINDLCLEFKDNKVVLCKKNKRNNITKYVDVTSAIFKLIVDNFSGESIVHVNDKMYNFSIKEFNDEEYKQYKLIENKKKRRAKEKFNMLPLICQAYSNTKTYEDVHPEDILDMIGCDDERK